MPKKKFFCGTLDPVESRGVPLSPLKMKSEPGFVIFGQFHYIGMCFKVDHPHQFPNATRPLF
jgi:hypothetical protein